jgi:tetratricopeptide (TPR) repeat protein
MHPFQKLRKGNSLLLRSAVRNRSAAVLLLFALVSTGTAARAVDRDKLRAATPLPRMETGFQFNVAGASALPQDEATQRARISALEALPAPLNGEQLMELASLQSLAKDSGRSEATYARAVSLLQEALVARPEEGTLLVQLGAASQGAGQLDEAEATLRRAVKVAPQNALAWTTFGDVLLQKATETMLPNKNGFQFQMGTVPLVEGLSTEVLDSRPAPEAMARAQALLDEANTSYERAVQVAPRDPQVYTKRMSFRLGAAFGSGLLQLLRANETMTLKAAMASAAQAAYPALYAPETAADLRTLARLKPDDVSTSGAAALATLYSFALSNKQELPLKNGLQSLPAPVAAQMREPMERLQTLSGTPKSAAAALEALGVIGFVLGDPSTVETLRRSLALDPSRAQAAEMLIGLFAEENRFEELATLLDARLKRPDQDTARNHLLLAKAYDKLGRPQDVEAQVNAALKREPNDLSANLAHIALLLRAGDVTQADEQIIKMLAPPAKPSQTQMMDYLTLRGVSLGMSEQTDAAKQMLHAVLVADARNEAAPKVLAVLDSQGP